MSDAWFEPEYAAKLEAITEHVPSLLMLRASLMAEGREPIGVVLPAALDPGGHDGPADATDAPALLMGLPVTWGSQVGLIYGVLS